MQKTELREVIAARLQQPATPLAYAILALTCSAMLCGSRSDTAIAAWGRNSGARPMQALGFLRPPPGAATLHTVLRRVDREEGEAKLGAWAEGLRSGTHAPQDTAAGIAIDGKPSWR